MNIRPPLTFDVIKPDVKHYIRFNPETGFPIGCSTEAKGHCVEISEELAVQIKKGFKNLMDYRVKLVDNKYVVQTKNAVQNVNHLQTNCDVIENRTVYEIKTNQHDACVRLVLDMKEKLWKVTVDDALKTNLIQQVNSDHTHKFFVTDNDNSAVLDYTFDLNIQELLKDEITTIKHTGSKIPRLFCRKVYNYSYEVVK